MGLILLDVDHFQHRFQLRNCSWSCADVCKLRVTVDADKDDYFTMDHISNPLPTELIMLTDHAYRVMLLPVELPPQIEPDQQPVLSLQDSARMFEDKLVYRV